MSSRLLLPAGFLVLLISSCAINEVSSNVTPGVDLTKFRSFRVIKAEREKNDVHELIASYLRQLGYEATAGDALDVPGEATILVKYSDDWSWDFTPYMLSLSIQFSDVNSGFHLASGEALHTSFTRKSPEEMVAEVISSIFGEPTEQVDGEDSSALSVERMTYVLDPPPSTQQPVSVTVVGQGIDWATDDSFHEALVVSLRESGIFEKVAGDEGSEYTLVVSLLSTDSSPLQWKMSVRSMWQLYRTSDRAIVWQKEIVGEAKNPVGAVLIPLEGALRRGNFGRAVRSIIQKGLTQLAGVEFP